MRTAGSQTEERLDRLYRLLVAAADGGEPAPTNNKVAELLGLNTSGIVSRYFAALVSRGQITVENRGRGGRDVTITGVVPTPTRPVARAAVDRAAEARASKSRIHANGETVTALEMSRCFNGPPAKKCQWIAGLPTGDDSCKCLDPVEPGKPYCPPHQARVYSKVQPVADLRVSA